VLGTLSVTYVADRERKREEKRGEKGEIQDFKSDFNI
jgi:hypothetical protein